MGQNGWINYSVDEGLNEEEDVDLCCEFGNSPAVVPMRSRNFFDC